MDNHVADRCIILEGDNRVTAPKVYSEIFSPVELITCTMMAADHFASLTCIRGLLIVFVLGFYPQVKVAGPLLLGL